MGPTLNVGSLLRLPYGCGEQNMVNFAPSIYIMQYLSAVGQLTTPVKNKGENIMSTGKLEPLCRVRTGCICNLLSFKGAQSRYF